MTIQPRPGRYLIRLSKPAAETAGGLVIPETARENATEGEVLAAGVGLPIGDTGERHEMACEPGDVVVFQATHFQRLDEEGLGIVSEEDLVAIRDGHEIEPANDWVLIRPDERESESQGGIALPDLARKRKRSGMVATLGHGRIRHKGELAGTRKSCLEIMGIGRRVVGDEFHFLLLDAPPHVYWDSKARTVSISGDSGRWVLVRAGDLIAMEG